MQIPWNKGNRGENICELIEEYLGGAGSWITGDRCQYADAI